MLENSAEISESDIYLAQKEGYETFADFENKVDSVADVTNMLKKMSQANDLQSDENVEKEDVDELIENELKKVEKYQEARFRKIERAIVSKMKFLKDNLKEKWNEKQQDMDHAALKEFRSEFEVTHRHLNFMVSEWEKRKISNMLCDYLTDLIEEKMEDYMVEYRKMDEVKRVEAALLRKKNQNLEEYK